MIKITRNLVRPSVDIPFFSSTAEFRNYFDTNYVDTGKAYFGDPEAILSDDGLTKTQIFYWRSAADLEAHRVDPITIRDHIMPMNQYNLIHNITTTVVQENLE